MKDVIKKIIPQWIIRWNRNRKSNKFKNMSTDQVFTEIYKNNFWENDESISGHGSELRQTESLIEELQKLFHTLEIMSILDIPCGDFNWMQHVDFSKVHYTGADIVEDLIISNQKRFKDFTNVNFEVLNLLTDTLLNKDLIIVRDCFVHLSNQDIKIAIENIKSSNSKYLLTTSYSNCIKNRDIITGSWRPLNFQLAPFNFPSPELIIDEVVPADNLQDKGKTMALYKISQL